MKKTFLLIVLAISFLFGCAKKETTEVIAEKTPDTPVMIIEEEPNVTESVDTTTNVVTTEETVTTEVTETISEEPQTVYRVQIFASYSEENANKVAAEAREKMPDVPVHVVHIEPYYKVRVGDCKTPEEAAQLVERCKSVGYEDAWKTEDILMPGE